MRTLVCLLAIAILAPTALARQACTQPFFVVVQPQPQPRPQPSPSCQAKPSKDQVRMARAAAARTKEENERICEAIQAERLRKWQAAQTIDPNKDEYRKYLAAKQAKADTLADPDATEMQEFYKEQEGRNDYRKWLESRDNQPKETLDDFGEWRKNNPQAEQKATMNMEKFGQDLQKSLDREARPQSRSKKANPIREDNE